MALLNIMSRDLNSVNIVLLWVGKLKLILRPFIETVV